MRGFRCHSCDCEINALKQYTIDGKNYVECWDCFTKPKRTKMEEFNRYLLLAIIIFPIPILLFLLVVTSMS
jgi:hypothetical protein